MVPEHLDTRTTGETSSPKGAGPSAITRRLFRAAFLLYLTAAVLITGVLVAEAYLSTRNDLERELSIYQRTLEGALANPLWSLDLDEVATISTGMVEIPEISGVLVRDHNRRIEFARAGEVPQDPSAPDPSGGWLGTPITLSFDVHYSHAVGRDMVGHVTIYSSRLLVLERVRWQVSLLILTAVVKTILLWFIFNWVSRSILVRPLIELTAAARRTEFQRLETIRFDAETAAAAEGTEIEVLREAFNDMVAKLRQSRDALAQSKADLERRVTERTRELVAQTSETAAAMAKVEQSRRQVAAALEEAERAARAKSEFLALVSHELRTPLNTVLGFAELQRQMIKDAPDGPDLATFDTYAAAIHESGSHLLTLINDILDLSRIEAGRMEVNPEWIDTAATTRTVVEILRDPATKRRLSLESRIGDDSHALKVDPRRYRQMLMNLLSNAVKYTEAGGSIYVDSSVRSDGWLEIGVVDDGVGMAPTDIARALEPFGRIGSPQTSTAAGTGLGLPLVARMMQLHGGRLAIDSKVGEGTRAILRFPPACHQAQGAI